MVMKLLGKTAEERYQTAAAVEADLRRFSAISTTWPSSVFDLAQRRSSRSDSSARPAGLSGQLHASPQSDSPRRSAAAEYRGRGRETLWQGNLAITRNRIARFVPVNFLNPERIVQEMAAGTALAWSSVTTGRCRLPETDWNQRIALDHMVKF
jgi:hypothetical protein